MKKLEKIYKEFAGKEFEDSCFTTPDFASFSRKFKNALKKDAEEAGLELSSYSRGHFEISAFLENSYTGKIVYLRVSEVRNRDCAAAMSRVLIRTAKSAKDFTGGQNYFVPLTEVVSSAKRLTDF